MPWTAPTLPWVAVAFHGPAFSETSREWAALDILSDLAFGPTSALYKRLVEDEQKVDRLAAARRDNVDPELFTVIARVKKAEDAPYVRDEILQGVRRRAAAAPPPAQRVADAKSANRYGFLRGARQHRGDRGRRSRASCATAARTTRSTSCTARTTR